MTGAPIGVRPATLKDAKFMAQWHASSFDPPWTQADLKAHIQNPHDHVLVSSDGFIIMRYVTPDIDLDQLKSGYLEAGHVEAGHIKSGQAEILTLVVAPNARGAGQGKALVEAAQDWIWQKGRGVQRLTIFLDVAVDNGAAIRLYERLDYHHYGDRPGYYRRAHGRVGARLYQKTLTQKLA